MLDFINTVTGRDERPRDWLPDYAGLVGWAEMVGLIDQDTLNALADRSRTAPASATKALSAAKVLREALFDICQALIRREDVDASALACLEAAWTKSVARQSFAFRDSRLVVAPGASPAGLDLVSDAVAMRAVSWLSNGDLRRLGMCQGVNCAWLFVDTSKAGRRRWCDMATCGNSAKARRHARRHQSHPS